MGVLLTCGFLEGTGSLFAQGTLVLQTGGGGPLVSGSQTISLSGAGSQQLVFDFGFYSDEIPAPNVFLDSFTITIQAGPAKTAVLVVTDASGPVWAPPSAGGIFLADSDVVRMPITPPAGAPVSGRGVAYTVTYSLDQFTDSDVTIYFDLFDNQDQTGSLGWYSPVRLVPVPEPSIMALSGLGSLLFLIRRNQTHADRGP